MRQLLSQVEVTDNTLAPQLIEIRTPAQRWSIKFDALPHFLLVRLSHYLMKTPNYLSPLIFKLFLLKVQQQGSEHWINIWTHWFIFWNANFLNLSTMEKLWHHTIGAKRIVGWIVAKMRRFKWCSLTSISVEKNELSEELQYECSCNYSRKIISERQSRSGGSLNDSSASFFPLTNHISIYHNQKLSAIYRKCIHKTSLITHMTDW